MNGTDRKETIFAEALLLSPDQRGEYLDRTCHGDADLRRRVEELLLEDLLKPDCGRTTRLVSASCYDGTVVMTRLGLALRRSSFG